jgi:hypothetical protein
MNSKIDRRSFTEQGHNLDTETCKRLNEQDELLAKVEEDTAKWEAEQL